MHPKAKGVYRRRYTPADVKKTGSPKEFLYILPFMILIAVFCYYPVLGWIRRVLICAPETVKNGHRWLSIAWMTDIVANPITIRELGRVLRNTCVISGITLFFSWIPMILALLINEVRNRTCREMIRTAVILPGLLSWVLVFAFGVSFLSPDGAANTLLLKMDIIGEKIPFLKSSDAIWLRQWGWYAWKNMGWNAVLYLAAIRRIDEKQYEAARLDGASSLQIMESVTLPQLLPTYFVLLMISLAGFLTNGTEQYFLFRNSFNKDYIEVMDLYLYNVYTDGGNLMPLAPLLSILKTAVGLILLNATNTVSKLVRGKGFI